MNKNITPTKNGGRKLKNDLIFIISLIVILVCVGLGVYFFRKPGDTVKVLVDGNLYGTYSLQKEREIEIKIGDNLNILVIKDGKADMIKASCPDSICVKHRPISKNGETITCLPNKVTVIIEINDKQGEVDVIV
ncbi:MAG: NusG domain II-containing protein [Clostridiales bacterium]|nr:NusG domain II-containing protein [Clostridiales bacterium]